MQFFAKTGGLGFFLLSDRAGTVETAFIARNGARKSYRRDVLYLDFSR